MPQEENSETYLTLGEAARNCYLSRSTILQLVDMDIVPSYGSGERLSARFKKSEMDSLVTKDGALYRRRKAVYKSSAIQWARGLLSQPDWAIVAYANQQEPVTEQTLLTDLAIVSPQAEILFCELINPGIEGFHTPEVPAASFAAARTREEVWPEILEITGQFDRLVDQGDSALSLGYTNRRLGGLEKKWEKKGIAVYYFQYDFELHKGGSNYLKAYRHHVMFGALTGALDDALAGLACIKDMAAAELDPDPAPAKQ